MDDVINIVVEATKSLVVANIEEFTHDYIEDKKRDTVLINVEEIYVQAIKKIMFEMDYGLVLQHYHEDKDSMTLVFTRW